MDTTEALTNAAAIIAEYHKIASANDALEAVAEDDTGEVWFEIMDTGIEVGRLHPMDDSALDDSFELKALRLMKDAYIKLLRQELSLRRLGRRV